MLNNLKKITSVMLALSLVFSLAACGKSDNSSEDVEVEYQYEYVYESDNQGGTTSDKDKVSKDESSNKTSSKDDSGKNDSGENSKPANSSNDKLKKLRGTTVKYATWKDPALNEDGPVVEKFQKEYGIKVDIVYVPQTGYSNTIQGLIASGKSPDVYFSTGDFPNCLSCLQPLSAAKLDTNDKIWDQATFKMTTFKGDSYLCNTVGNIWNEVDCLFYNKSLWKQAGITSTPAEFDKAGKWNWDTLEQIMTAVSKLKNRAGGAIDTTFALASTGNSLYKLKNGKFISGIDNKETVEVMKKISKWKQAGIISGDRDTFAAGNVGVYITNAFGLKKTGFFADSNWDDIGFYFIPDFNSKIKTTPSGIFRGWGLIRGAKNPEGAGVFLRYYLDVNNYDTTNAFISPDAETFFFQLTTGEQSEKTPYFTYLELIDTITGVNSPEVYGVAKTNTPDQVSAKLATYKNAVKAGAEKINKFVDKNTGVK